MNDIAKSAVNRKVTCFLDFSAEILLLICRYLSPCDVLHSFYTPSTPGYRLHRVISDYHTKMKLEKLSNNEYYSLLNLFCSESIPQLDSLILSSEYITCLTENYFSHIRHDINGLMFNHLKSLKLLDCTSQDVAYLLLSYIDCPNLKDFHLRIKNNDEKQDLEFSCFPKWNISVKEVIFARKMSSIETLVVEMNNGLSLNRSLTPHRNLRNLSIDLKTIDDLFLLLDGLVPNIKTMVIHLFQKRILSCVRPKSSSVCLQLNEFSLYEPRIEFIVDDLKSMFHFMPNLNKLMLSIRDTPDPLFCHGPSFESILAESLPNLRQFDYTMTHRIIDEQLIADFVRWPMNIVHYLNEKSKWIHVYSFPWPSSKGDQRRLPIVQTAINTSVTSEVKRSEYMEHVLITQSEEFYQLKTNFLRVRHLTTGLTIPIELPRRISKLILSKQTNLSLLNGIIHPSIDHLIVKCPLNNVDQLSNLAQRFPRVKYLELSNPLSESSYLNYLQVLFRLEGRLWSDLIHLTVCINNVHCKRICDDETLMGWIMENTDLKYHPNSFYVRYFHSKVSIWF